MSREVSDASHIICRDRKSHRMSCREHKQAHQRHRRPVNQPDNRRPHKEIPHEGKDSTRQEDHPRPTKTTVAVAIECDEGVEEARKNAGAATDILEDCDSFEGGLVVVLGGLEGGRVDAESVGTTYAALDPYASHRSYPF